MCSQILLNDEMLFIFKSKFVGSHERSCLLMRVSPYIVYIIAVWPPGIAWRLMLRLVQGVSERLDVQVIFGLPSSAVTDPLGR